MPEAGGKPGSGNNDSSGDLNGLDDGEDPNEVVHKGHVILLTTGFRMDKDMYVVLFRTRLEIYKSEENFGVRRDC